MAGIDFELSAPVPEAIKPELETKLKELYALVKRAKELENPASEYLNALAKIAETGSEVQELCEKHKVLIDVDFTDLQFGDPMNYLDGYFNPHNQGALVAGTWLPSSLRC
jgi:formate dehydrogenase maturation protein FdhE